MDDRVAGSSARVLALAALVACAIAFLMVLLGSGSGDDKADGSRTSSGRSNQAQTDTGRQRRPRRASTGGTYTVKAGDTLGGIAEKTGVPVERLQELNPQLDPQALVSGQKLQLR